MKRHTKGDIQRMVRVLVADDDAMTRLLACTTLENLGLEVEEAADGAAAVELFEEKRFDLVMLDLDMPRLNGLEACIKMRSMFHGHEAAIVICTGKSDADSISQAYKAGATDFLIKPLNWQVITHHVPFMLRAQNAFRSVSDSQAKLHEAQRIARIGGWDWFVDTDENLWSEEMYRILGLDPKTCKATYSHFLGAVHPKDRMELNRVLSQALETGKGFSTEFRVPARDRKQRIVICEGKVESDNDGRPVRVHGVVQDITERRDAEATIHRLAFYDGLTGLPNREMFISHAARTLDASRRSGTKLAVILLNLDRFKRINDSLSHEAGDQLLQIVAERISSHGLQTGTGDGGAPEESPFFAARSGGDEFMILLSGLRRSERISKFLRQLLGELARPVRVDQQEVFITARMGISLYAEDGEDLPTLLVNADTALSRAKREGGNCYRFYAKDMNLRAKERLSMEAQLNRAIDNEEFRLFYQPQINLATGALEGFEALLRWFPGRDRVVSPAEFIPILEETGLISPVGEWVLNAACSQLKAWVEEGYEPTRVAVNLSANQFRHEQLASSIQKAIDAHGVMPACLELELTETIIMQDAAKNRETLMALKEIGLRLSVDDFGTGYSSMSYLKLFPLDTLKIDRAFVMELEKGTNDESIVRAIVALSKGLGLNSVAEGVETVQQRELLAHLGCDIAQGFLISKPVPAQDAAAFLRANGKSRHLSHGGTERLGNNSLDGDPSPISLDLAR